MSDTSNYSGDLAVDKKISQWLKWDRNEATRNEINSLISAKKWDILKARLIPRISFGTAGLRGVMRAGFDSMNDLVIVQAAQGLCEYILKQYPNKSDLKRGVVFGYDGRHNSKRFAELSACVFINRKVNVLLFSKMVVTPFIPFTILQKKCLAGVMVTASHNPKDDNGYKVYWTNGAQIIPPHDKNIHDSILNNLEPLDSSWKLENMNYSEFLSDPFEEIFETYFNQLEKSLPQKFLEINMKSNIKIVYTAMHGVGYPFIKRAFEVAALKAVIPVEEQCEPDPEFSTVKFPNPEEGKASLDLALKKADLEGVAIVLANDPDADRLALAEKNPKTGQWKVFNGNELGALIGWWSLRNFQELNPNADLSQCYILGSTVSSKLLKSMAAIEGFQFEETLTGFKWMGNLAKELLNKNKHVLFAFEEAIGFMFSTMVLDKDGISAAFHLATMASYLKEQEEINLYQKLQNIYDKYGYHCTNCSYFLCYNPEVINAIFERLRNFRDGVSPTYPESILNGEFKIKHIRDLTIGLDTSQPDNKANLPTDPSTQMITFTFDNGLVVTIRTSGTEPKIKYYAELCSKPEEKDWDLQRSILSRMVKGLIDELIQPTKNNLTPQAN